MTPNLYMMLAGGLRTVLEELAQYLEVVKMGNRRGGTLKLRGHLCAEEPLALHCRLNGVASRKGARGCTLSLDADGTADNITGVFNEEFEALDMFCSLFGFPKEKLHGMAHMEFEASGPWDTEASFTVHTVLVAPNNGPEQSFSSTFAPAQLDAVMVHIDRSCRVPVKLLRHSELELERKGPVS